MKKRSSCQSKEVSTLGQVVALLCFTHCVTFIVAYTLLGLGIAFLPTRFLHLLDNVWIHTSLAIVAGVIGLSDLALAGKGVRVSAILVLCAGLSLMAISICWEMSYHPDVTSGPVEHSHQGCLHLHSPAPHVLFVIGNLCVLGAHRLQSHNKN